jgi:hypothetical protein
MYVRSHSVLASSHVSLPPSISDCKQQQQQQQQQQQHSNAAVQWYCGTWVKL